MEIIYENQELCTKCGGSCCKKSGCDYSATDFDSLKINDLELKLKEGNISIVSVLTFKELKNYKLTTQSFLYLRARNKNRPVIDLVSLKTPCSMLTEKGCTYQKVEDRPSGGVNLIPKSGLKCYPLQDPEEIVDTWRPYQNILARLVKRLSGDSVYERLRKDIQLLFLTMLKKDFEDVSMMERIEVQAFYEILQKAYPDLFKNAQQEYLNQLVLKRNTRKK